MKRFCDVVGRRAKALLTTPVLVVVAMSIAFGLTNATSNSARAPVQNPASVAPVYEFDVATIKPALPTRDNGGVAGFLTEDSFRSKNFPLRAIIRMAYGKWGGEQGLVSGGPGWLDSEKYDITAKMDSSVADAVKRLRPDQRKLTQERMLQGLLADRLRLAVHRETKELRVYLLTAAKNGSKLHEAKPDDHYSNAFPEAGKFAGGTVKAGDIFLVGGGGSGGSTMTIYGFGVSMPALARQLTIQAGQTVLDMTGFTGSYDFTLKYGMNLMRRAPEDVPDAQPVLSASDPTGSPDLFAAIQQQLGLKLESGKGPVEVIVIDRVERPSGN